MSITNLVSQTRNTASYLCRSVIHVRSHLYNLQVLFLVIPSALYIGYPRSHRVATGVDEVSDFASLVEHLQLRNCIVWHFLPHSVHQQSNSYTVLNSVEWHHRDSLINASLGDKRIYCRSNVNSRIRGNFHGISGLNRSGVDRPSCICKVFRLCHKAAVSISRRPSIHLCSFGEGVPCLLRQRRHHGDAAVSRAAQKTTATVDSLPPTSGHCGS